MPSRLPTAAFSARPARPASARCARGPSGGVRGARTPRCISRSADPPLSRAASSAPECAQPLLVHCDYDRGVVDDVRQDRLTRSLSPLVASVERVLAALALLDRRVRAHEEIRVAVVERGTVVDDVHLPALQERQRLALEPGVEA